MPQHCGHCALHGNNGYKIHTMYDRSVKNKVNKKPESILSGTVWFGLQQKISLPSFFRILRMRSMQQGQYQSIRIRKML